MVKPVYKMPDILINNNNNMSVVYVDFWLIILEKCIFSGVTK